MFLSEPLRLYPQPFQNVVDQGESLRPDLIITQAVCDVCAVAESEVAEAACRLPSAPQVINLEPMRLADVFDCIRLVGDAAGVTERAAAVVNQLQSRVSEVERRCQQARQVYLADGNAYFNRPGPRLVDSLEILAHAIHPGVCSLRPEVSKDLINLSAI